MRSVPGSQGSCLDRAACEHCADSAIPIPYIWCSSTITWDKQPLELVIYAPVDSDASVGLPLTAPEETSALEYIWPSAKGGRRVIAGLTGCVNMGHLYVSLLWVDKSVRGTGLGRRLMQRAEEEARRLGCDKAFVDTQSFQSPGFYARLEYEEMYRVRGCFGRKDIDRIYFGKSLVRDETD